MMRMICSAALTAFAVLVSASSLAFEIPALAVGYDCGEWFVRSAADDEVSAGDAQDAGHVRMSYEVQPRRVDARWDMVRVTRRGLCASGESAAFEQIESGFRLILR